MLCIDNFEFCFSLSIWQLHKSFASRLDPVCEIVPSWWCIKPSICRINKCWFPFYNRILQFYMHSKNILQSLLQSIDGYFWFFSFNYKNINRMGPKTVSWGTPALTSFSRSIGIAIMIKNKIMEYKRGRSEFEKLYSWHYFSRDIRFKSIAEAFDIS